MRRPAHRVRRAPIVLLLIGLLGVTGVCAQSGVTVAVAANFEPTMTRLAAIAERELGVSVTIVAGSTGQLYAQIARGAPFDLFAAADADRPARLADAGLAIERMTYAIGELALWSARAARLEGATLETALQQSGVRHVALANPRLAPYGVAARETLDTLGLWRALEPRVVYGETVGQALAMAASENAELAFVALSLVIGRAEGAFLRVPTELHEPIRQDAALLARAADNRGARALFEFLASEQARAAIVADGYSVPQ